MKKRFLASIMSVIMILGMPVMAADSGQSSSNIKAGVYKVGDDYGDLIEMTVTFDENGITDIIIDDYSYLASYFAGGSSMGMIKDDLIKKALETQTYKELDASYPADSGEAFCAQQFSSALYKCMLEAGMIQPTVASIKTSSDGEWTDERMASLSGVLLYNSLKDPYSLEINKITTGYQDITYGDGYQVQDIQTVIIVFHAANGFGNSVIATAEAYVWPKDDEPTYYQYMYDDTIPEGKPLILNILESEYDIPTLKDEKRIDVDTVVSSMDDMLMSGLYD